MAKIIALTPTYEILPAQKRRYKEVMVFVHHYGGHRGSFRRHMEWLNELGFDCVTFDLPIRDMSELYRIPISKEWKFGLRHIWADRIETVLDSIPEKKILFTFSFASISGLDAITRRRAIDMTGWICDGGPFRRIEEGFQSLIESGPLIPPQWHKLDTPFVRKLILVRLAKLSSWLCGSTDYDKDIDRMLALLPDHFPVLSIRCEQDTLVKPAQIEDFFNKTNHLQLNSVTLKKAGHLLGFRDEPELYKEWVSRFLETVAQPV